MNGLNEIERANLRAELKHEAEVEQKRLMDLFKGLTGKIIKYAEHGNIGDGLEDTGEYIKLTFEDDTVFYLEATSPCDNIDFTIK